MGNIKDSLPIREKPLTIQQILEYPSDLIPSGRLKTWRLDMSVSRRNLYNHFGIDAVKIENKYYLSREALIQGAWTVWNNPRKHQALLLQLGEAIWGKRPLTDDQREYRQIRKRS